MIIRRMNAYEIFLRMIHNLLWLSRHQKQGDRRPYLQRGSTESVPREAKLFPDPIPIMAPFTQWTMCSLPIDESHPLLGHHQVDLQKEIDGADLLETPDYFPVRLPCDLRQVGDFLWLHRVASPIELTATI